MDDRRDTTHEKHPETRMIASGLSLACSLAVLGGLEDADFRTEYLVMTGQWSEATKVLEAEVIDHPEDTLLWYQLSQVRASQGDSEGAFEALDMAEGNPAIDPSIQYTRAGLHAAAGQVEEALEALNLALELGFHAKWFFPNDPRFQSLQQNSEFQRILARMDPLATVTSEDPINLATLRPERQMDFLVGDWYRMSAGAFLGRSSNVALLQGAVIQKRDATSTSFHVFDPTLQRFKQTWCSGAGHHDTLEGSLEDGKLVLIQDVLRGQPGAIGRSTFFNIAKDSYDYEWHTSGDQGATWTLGAKYRFVRIEK